ncbi:sigma-70 family RNA polymerase sigma factor [Paenibacillus sp. PR3]|uniref:Sigma-70 family RNA polymerase sigma factor n=1 Tax=Paenibacillus terricola TaxID=2763503 RepID=A0ABR8MWX5_9BACL|nr:sigma-70 family RNA polymerase sigma factor [Paenibacillus terricola]MBD3920465.1 sigma-70 family RNA polymerase sigma factor [Paenibacillus terricola]
MTKCVNPSFRVNQITDKELTLLDEFAKLEPYIPGLKIYCRSLTGSDWDADELVQDVWTKIWLALERDPDRPISRSFLFRIAKNAWIDRYRRERKRQGDAEYVEDYLPSIPFGVEGSLARELLEQLAESLNPRQMVLVILIDAFAFSAAESAALLRMTEGAVKEGLKRARRRLQAFKSGSRQNNGQAGGKHKSPDGTAMTASLFETFLKGFRQGDADMICRAYLSLAAQGVTIEKVSREAGRYSFTMRDPNGHLIEFVQNI